MRDEVMSEELPQQWAVEQIEERFDANKFTYQNRNGNRAIKPAVLREFRLLTEGRIVWSLSEKAWRKQKTPIGKRLID
jgi:uncharacterized protein DUF6953